MEVIENVWGREELFNLNFEKVACSHRHIFGEKKFKCHGQDSPDLTVICRASEAKFHCHLGLHSLLPRCKSRVWECWRWSHVLLMKETLQLTVCKILTICKIFAYPKWCRIFSIHSITRFCQFGGPKDPKGLGFCSWGSLFPSYGTSKTICTSEGEIAVREPMFPRFEGGRTRKTNFFWVDPESCESCTGSILVLGDLLNRLKKRW